MVRGALAAVLLLLSSRAGATVVPRLHLEDLARNAGVIVQGRILRHWSAWDAERRFIWTHYALRVSDVLKGSPPQVVIISEPGGTVEGLTVRIADVVWFADQEEVVVFLHSTPIGYWRTYGYAQGKFTVLPLQRGGARVRTNLAGLTLIDPAPALAQPRPASASPLGRLDGMPLGEFKERVRTAVGRREK